MEIKTCEEYVLSKLQTYETENEALGDTVDKYWNTIKEQSALISEICSRARLYEDYLGKKIEFASINDKDEVFEFILNFLVKHHFISQ